MRVWIVVGEIGNYETWQKTVTAGKDLMKKYNLEISVYHREDITYYIGGDGKPGLFANGVETEAPDRVLLWGRCDGMMEGISNQLTAMGTVSINTVEAKRIAGSKLATAQLLAGEDIPQAECMPIYRNTPKELIIKEIGLPLVVKPDGGFGGAGIELLHTEEELEHYLESLPEKPQEVVLAQKFIVSSKGRDVRVLMIGGKPVAAAQRYATNDSEFRSNVHLGGSWKNYDITDDMKVLCEKTAKLSGLTICGLDLLFGENGFIIGEINCSPGMDALVPQIGMERFVKIICSAL